MPGKKRSRLKRWLIWILGILFSLAAIGAGLAFWRLTSFFSRDTDDLEYVSLRFSQEKRPELWSYPAQGLQVRAIQGGLDSGPRILFVHGSPGSWRDYSGYLADTELRRRAQLLAFDRPGFGETAGSPEPSLKRQAALAVPLLESDSSDQPTLVLGYSLGGPVAAQLALDNSSDIDGLILVAPSIDPELEELRWYNRLAALPGLSYLLPEALSHSNMEIFPLKKELLRLRSQLSKLDIPTVVIQGLEDGLVPPENADFVARLLPGSRIVRVPGMGHGILWQARELITGEILGLLSRVVAAASVDSRGLQPLPQSQKAKRDLPK